MSATTFLSRIFLSLIFLFQTNTKGKKKKTKKKKKSKERLKKTTTKKKTKETRSNFFLLAIISLPASSQILVIFTATLRIISFCKLKKLRVLWWKFFPEFCLFDLLLSSSFLCFFSPSFFWIAHSVLLPVFSVSVIVGFVDRLFVCVCVCVCVCSLVFSFLSFARKSRLHFVALVAERFQAGFRGARVAWSGALTNTVLRHFFAFLCGWRWHPSFRRSWPALRRKSKTSSRASRTSSFCLCLSVCLWCGPSSQVF